MSIMKLYKQAEQMYLTGVCRKLGITKRAFIGLHPPS